MAQFPVDDLFTTRFKGIDFNGALKHAKAYAGDIEIGVYHAASGGWYIIPDRAEYDDRWELVGPYDDPDDAFVHLKLLATYMED